MSSQFASRFFSPFVLAVAVLAVASCAPGTKSGDSTPGDSGGSTVVGGSAFDPCTLLSSDDVAAVLGETVTGKLTGDTEGVGCLWVTPELKSVGVAVGNSGSAPNNTLPASSGDGVTSTPGPDGMRFTEDGVVEFAASNRYNSVQIAVVGMDGDAANAAAVDVAKKIAPKIPA
jgi:hypothetical protein